MTKITAILLLMFFSANSLAAQQINCLAKLYHEYIENRVDLFSKAKAIMANSDHDSFLIYKSQLNISITAAVLNKIAFNHLLENKPSYLKLDGKITRIVPSLDQYLAYSQGKPLPSSINKVYTFLENKSDFKKAYSNWQSSRESLKQNSASNDDKIKAYNLYKTILANQLKTEFELETSFFQMDANNLTCN
ncbi:hypothetical protein AADZ91_10890 [Colwelliaceae bacterium 6441]